MAFGVPDCCGGEGNPLLYEMKPCSCCKEVKPLTSFYRDPRAKNGLNSQCKPCCYKAGQRWSAKHPEALARIRKKSSRKERLKRFYGLTVADYEVLILKSGGKCAVCQNPFPSIKQRHIDHDHVTGKIRGLLCQRCNNALGLLDDSPERLRAAAAYLEAALDKAAPGGVE